MGDLIDDNSRGNRTIPTVSQLQLQASEMIRPRKISTRIPETTLQAVHNYTGGRRGFELDGVGRSQAPVERMTLPHGNILR